MDEGMLYQSMLVLAAILMFVSACAGWALNLIGLPGNWLVLALASVYAFLMPADQRVDIGLATLVGLLVLASVGELIEFVAGALGAAKAGGSKRGAILGLIGSLIGGFVGIFAPIPIPVVGSVVGALVFASLGALLGAVVGERWKGQNLDESLRIGHAAFWGRLLGTLGKVWVGCLMLVLVAVSLILE